MTPDVTGLPLEAAEAALRAAGLAYTLVRTATPYRHGNDPSKSLHDYAVRYEQGELIYVSFPVQSFAEDCHGT